MPQIKIKWSDLTPLECDLLRVIDVALAADDLPLVALVLMLGRTRALIGERKRLELAQAEPFGLLDGEEIIRILHPEGYARSRVRRERKLR